jgi:acetyl esterase
MALDEMVTMTRLMAREGSGFGIDPVRLAIGGDSAGANLALATTLVLRAAGEQPISFQLLIYGVYSTDTESPSWQQFGQGAGLSQTQMRWIWETYAESPDQLTDWRLAPLDADLAGLPPAFLIVGSLDPLLDDSNKLAAALKDAGVPCQLTVYQGINHGFIRYGKLIGTARRAIADCAAALKAGLA